ncbi:putative nucleic acid-binding protein [Actinoplanes lutulentus]|uniref:PIN domain-containing protein n=1 Tax=Actinoplanes lutulentus TaxID=1287878 RepID=A0A327Z9U8_9ACTN|nr:hypothetical protein [Actinoplanes lutulentus]MBB2946820.1 putative nucleic acid-binding protein [Actinoplanes lutulentus]RAK35712.1 hypothetical protein B0I29_109186 [Actinoplanes lutulentus]
MTDHQPRVLDASALVELFQGHPRLLELLGGAADGDFSIAVPAVAVAEAQAVLAVTGSAWSAILGRTGVTELPLSADAAVDVGDIARPRLLHHPVHSALIGPIMVGQVIWETKQMGAVVVTRVPEAYGGHDISVAVI